MHCRSGIGILPKRGHLQESRRHRNAAALLLRQFGFKIERIGIFDRARKLAHLAPLNRHGESLAGLTDHALVDCHGLSLTISKRYGSDPVSVNLEVNSL